MKPSAVGAVLLTKRQLPAVQWPKQWKDPTMVEAVGQHAKRFLRHQTLEQSTESR